jgi:hypothetical protein
MIKFLVSIFSYFILNTIVMACPACAGSLTNESDKYIVIALGVFILLTYIPFYILYSTIIKNRNANSEQQGSR